MTMTVKERREALMLARKLVNDMEVSRSRLEQIMRLLERAPVPVMPAETISSDPFHPSNTGFDGPTGAD